MKGESDWKPRNKSLETVLFSDQRKERVTPRMAGDSIVAERSQTVSEHGASVHDSKSALGSLLIWPFYRHICNEMIS